MRPFLVSIDVPASAPRRDGVVRATDIAVLAGAEQRAQAIVAQARDEAARELQVARAQAQHALQQAAAQAQSGADELNARLQAQWDLALGLVPACALAVARVAFERVGARLDLQQRIEAAVATAVRELPAPPVRFWLPDGVPTTTLPETVRRTDAVSVECDTALAAAEVAAEDGAVTVVCDFDMARATVSNALLGWLKSLLDDAALQGTDPHPTTTETP